MRTYHYSVRIGHGKTTFPTVALGSLRGSLAFFWKGRGVQSPWLAISQTYLSALFSCQRAVAKACCFHVKAWQSRKEGDIKPCGIDIRVLDDELAEALKKLPERKRNTLLMYYFLEMTESEIANFGLRYGRR